MKGWVIAISAITALVLYNAYLYNAFDYHTRGP